MVANVSDVSSSAGNGRASGEAGNDSDSDGFLQELLGIAGMMPMAAGQQPPMPAATDAASDQGEVGEIGAQAAAPLPGLPAWLMSASNEAPLETPVIQSTAAATAEPVVSQPATATLPDALQKALTAGPVDTAISTAAPANVNPKKSESVDAIASTIGSTNSTDSTALEPTMSAAQPAPADSTANSQSKAAQAFDIDHLFASMKRFEQERAPVKTKTAAADSGGKTTATDAFEIADVGALLEQSKSAELFSKHPKIAEQLLDDGSAANAQSTPQSADSAATPAMTQPVFEKADAKSIAEPRTLHARLGSPEWRDQLGTQLNWMVDNGKQSASLKLTPEHLGPVEVRIDVNQNQTSVWFSATQADTRTALEQALPRLRELMSAHGMSLNDAGVSREPPREQQRNPSGSTAGSFGFQESGEEIITISRHRTSLLDTYA